MLQANSVALVAISAPAGRRRAALGIQAGGSGAWAWRWARWRAGCWSPRQAGGRSSSSMSRSGWWRWRRPGSCCRAPANGLRQGTDPLGLILLAVAATGTLVTVSAVSGLGLPRPGLAGCAAVALLAGAGLVWWERRAAAPLVDLKMLAANGTWPLLAGALCAYLVLFGPLMLIPQVLTAHGGSVVHAGLLLAALPPGSGWPPWPARRSCPPAGRTGAAAWRRAAGQRLRRRAGDPRPGYRDSDLAGPARHRPGHLHTGQQHGDHDGDPARAGRRRRRDGEHGPRTGYRPGGCGSGPGAAHCRAAGSSFRWAGGGHGGAGRVRPGVSVGRAPRRPGRSGPCRRCCRAGVPARRLLRRPAAPRSGPAASTPDGAC